MGDLFEVLEKKRITLPENVDSVLTGCKSFKIFNSVRELAAVAVGDDGNNSYEVKYSILTLILGKRIRYIPRIPEIAPLAPIIGIIESVPT